MLSKRLAASAPLVAVALTGFLVPGLAGAVVFGLMCAVLLVAAVSEFFTLTAAADLPGYPKLTAGAALAILAASPFGRTASTAGRRPPG